MASGMKVSVLSALPNTLDALSPQIELSVSGIAGHVCALSANRSWTIRKVKEVIFTKTGIPAPEQVLLLGTVELDKDAARLLSFLPPGAVGRAVNLTLVRQEAAPPAEALREAIVSYTDDRHGFTDLHILASASEPQFVEC